MVCLSKFEDLKIFEGIWSASTNFTWSIFEYFVPKNNNNNSNDEKNQPSAFHATFRCKGYPVAWKIGQLFCIDFENVNCYALGYKAFTFMLSILIYISLSVIGICCKCNEVQFFQLINLFMVVIGILLLLFVFGYMKIEN